MTLINPNGDATKSEIQPFLTLISHAKREENKREDEISQLAKPQLFLNPTPV